MSTPPKIVWDWHPEDFSPPFSVQYARGLTIDSDGRTVIDENTYRAAVSIMAVAPDMESQGGKWYVVTAYNIPADQMETTEQSLLALCEMKWAEHINQL
jgi:hypothetical protein